MDRIPWASPSLRPLDDAAVHSSRAVSAVALVEGASGKHRMWLWVRNAAYDSTWMLAHQGEPVPPVAAGLSMTVPCDGKMDLEWFSSTTGAATGPAQTLECTSGVLRVTLPAIATDLAAALTQNDKTQM